MLIPRPEHPNPQFMRNNWENLNGVWEFEIDKSNSGKERRLYEAKKFTSEITVPFCPQSKLSGVGEVDFLNSVWYKREINVKKTDGLVILHIGACDYLSTIYVNGKEVGTHSGGYTSFSFDITDFVNEGTNTLVIHAEDDNRTKLQPSGKQSDRYYSYGCFYTRTIGIWQTVWLEYVPKTHIKSFKIYPDYKNGKVLIRAYLEGESEFSATAFYEGNNVGSAAVQSYGETADVIVYLSEIHLWEIGHGRLYDLVLTYGEDTVKTYFGLRNVALDGMKFMLNGKSVFQRTVLDQGYYPDGIYTAPTEEALVQDIKLSLAAGFNGARLHEKVFEPRFLYHADKMGYLVWGEYPNWGFDHTNGSLLSVYLDEWAEAIDRDFNHPSIIGWIPMNEVWDINGKPPCYKIIESVYKQTKSIDQTRPCIDASGGIHVMTDIYDFHEYTQDPAKLAEIIDKLENDGILKVWLDTNPIYEGRQNYNKEPVFASEYGGIKWDKENDTSAWGYGDAPLTEEDFIKRYKGLTEVLLKCPDIFGFCYTQLYDVEQERNGLYTYYRKPKFDMNIFKMINEQKAAIED